jgi:Subtilase family
MKISQDLIKIGLLLVGSANTVSARLRTHKKAVSSVSYQNSSIASSHITRKRYTNTTSSETRFIVSYKNDHGKQIALDLASTVHHVFHEHKTVAIELDTDGFNRLSNHEHIESIDIDSIWTEQGIVERVLEPDELDEFFKDPSNHQRYLNEQIPYGITMIQADKVSYGRNKAMVCIVDSGIASKHPDFNPSLVTGANRKTKATGTMLYWNQDLRGHGTHISGIVAARVNNKYGVRGVGHIPLYVTRGLDNNGVARESDIIDSINQCVAGGAKVINLSLSGGSMSKSFMSVIDGVYAKNVLVVAAAGNDGKRVAQYPASYNKVVSYVFNAYFLLLSSELQRLTNTNLISIACFDSVGAVDGSGVVWKGSNFGPWVDLTAPGKYRSVPGSSMRFMTNEFFNKWMYTHTL